VQSHIESALVNIKPRNRQSDKHLIERIEKSRQSVRRVDKSDKYHRKNSGFPLPCGIKPLAP
jgi:hypothetical protein